MSMFPFSYVSSGFKYIINNLMIRQTRQAETNIVADYTLKQQLISKTLANFQHSSLLTKCLFKQLWVWTIDNNNSVSNALIYFATREQLSPKLIFVHIRNAYQPFLSQNIIVCILKLCCTYYLVCQEYSCENFIIIGLDHFSLAERHARQYFVFP